MGKAGAIVWSILFFGPLLTMIALDGFCDGRELCRAGLTFTLLLYAGGILAFIAAVLVARLIFRALAAGAAARIRTMKVLFLIPLVPGLTVLALLFAGLAGRL
jgi:hypothetical protein